MEFLEWIESNNVADCHWYVKRLAGNDTGLTGGHQAGPYVPKSVIFFLFPSLRRSREPNPRTPMRVIFDSHGGKELSVSAIWYNNKTRDECRITGWGGKGTTILDPESTGALCVFAFHKIGDGDTELCNIWLCDNPEEEELLENQIEDVEPGDWLFYSCKDTRTIERSEKKRPARICQFTFKDFPVSWFKTFPKALDIVEKSIALTPNLIRMKPDLRLIERRACEYKVFRAIENRHVMPKIEKGFSNITEFMDYANSVSNRRKARAGRSLELHARGIFIEEDLAGFSHGERSEGNKKPDFLFPSASAYHDSKYPEKKLRMLAAKTTCKDRWRQICNEANRIKRKHLLTLQEGVSENQFEEMEKAGVVLVVPKPLHGSFPKSIRPKLLGLGEFIKETKELYS